MKQIPKGKPKYNRMVPTQYISASSITTATNIWTNTTITSSSVIPLSHWVDVSLTDVERDITIDENYEGDILMPDGSRIEIRNGNYTVWDKDAHITYRAQRVRDFNKFIAGSDLLEEFVRYLNALNLTKDEALQIPIQSFIMWLIIKAAERDQEDAPEAEKLLLEHTSKKLKKPRCKCCGRFLSYVKRNANIEFCNGNHMDKWIGRNGNC